MSEIWSVKEYIEYLKSGKEPGNGHRSGGDSTDVPAERTEQFTCSGRRNKYGNRRVQIGNRWFDSVHEAQVYEELMLKVRSGELRCVICQVRFDLLYHEKLQYVADFLTLDNNMQAEVLDAKSEATRQNRVYQIKRKLMKEQWGIEIREV